MNEPLADLAQSLLRLEINTIIKADMSAESTSDSFRLLEELALDYYSQLGAYLCRLPKGFEDRVLEHELEDLRTGMLVLRQKEEAFFLRVASQVHLEDEQVRGLAALLAVVLLAESDEAAERFLLLEPARSLRQSSQQLLRAAAQLLEQEASERLDDLLTRVWRDEPCDPQFSREEVRQLMTRLGGAWVQRFLLRDLLHWLRTNPGALTACFNELQQFRQAAKVEDVQALIGRFQSIVSLARLCLKALPSREARTALRMLRQSEMILEILKKHSDVPRNEFPQRVSLNDTVKIQKAWDIGTEQVLMQTCISLAGDVTTRLSPDLDKKDATQSARGLHQQSVSHCVFIWSHLLKLFSDLTNTTIGAIFGQSGKDRAA